MRKTLAAILGLAVLGFGATTFARTMIDHRDPSLGGSAYALNASGVVELTLTRSAQTSTACETRNLQGQADPVLHILRAPTGSGAVSELARDDDSGGGFNARVTFRAPSTGRYLVVMRASGPLGFGKADLYCDGRLVWNGVNVGGAFKRMENLRTNESIRTVTLPGGPRVHQLYVLDDDGKMYSRYESGASESAYISSGLQGVRTMMVASRWPDPAGQVRLIRNDNAISGHDPDGDGLGTELEKHIGTCSTRNEIAGGWDCSRATDARDTDGDAIRDNEELIGRLGSAPYQWLPRWGADPRHKDIFIEVDFGQERMNETPVIPCMDDAGQQLATTLYFCAYSARRMAKIYADTAQFYPVDRANPDPDAPNKLMRLMHAQSLNNPDLKAGISLHMDTGLTPAPNAQGDLTIYGDWGGHDYVAPVCDANGNCRRANPDIVRSTMMHANRRGLFHYALGDPGCGGQADGPRVWLNLPLCSDPGAAHELGHTLGLAHYGPKGTGLPNQADGSGEDLNCKPNYPSIMNYGYSAVSAQKFIPTFSDGYGRAVLNDASLNEQGAVPQPSSLAGARYLALLRDVYAYNVDMAAGNVDWNRDGVFSTLPVRANANFHANTSGGCEGTRSSRIRAAGLTVLSPALTRAEGRTMIFYINDADQKLTIEYTDSALNCPAFGQGCGVLQRRTVFEAWNAGILAVDAHPIRVNNQTKLLVVYRTSAGLFEATMTAQFGWTAPVAIATPTLADGEFALAGSGDVTWLAFKDAAGAIYLKTRSASGAWSADEQANGAGGAPLNVLSAEASPGLLKATYKDGREVLVGAFAAPNSANLLLYERSVTGNVWTPAPWFNTLPLPVFGRPAMTFEAVDPASPLPGRLRLLYMKGGDAKHQAVDGMLIYDRTLGQTKLLTSNHDNSALGALGADLLYEPGIDTNLRAVLALNYEDDDPGTILHSIWLRPKADGIVAHVQRDFNDWEALGIGVCRSLLDGGAQVTCADWPYSTRPQPPVGPPPVVVAPPVRPVNQCSADCTEAYRECIAQSDVIARRACSRQRTMCMARCPN